MIIDEPYHPKTWKAKLFYFGFTVAVMGVIGFFVYSTLAKAESNGVVPSNCDSAVIGTAIVLVFAAILMGLGYFLMRAIERLKKRNVN